MSNDIKKKKELIDTVGKQILKEIMHFGNME